MKVKNIVFSGFMAAIMMGAGATAANAAVSVASKAYVDAEDAKIETTVANLTTTVDGKADKATTLAGYGITDAYTISQTDAKFETIENVKEKVDMLSGMIEGGEGVEGGGVVSQIADLEGRVTETERLIGDDSVADQIAAAITKENLSQYATTETVDAELAKKLDASVYNTDKETFATKTEIADMATDEEVSEAIAGLGIGDYAKSADVAEDIAAAKTEIEGAFAAADTALDGKITTAQTTAEQGVADAAAINAKLKTLATADVPAACTSGSTVCVLTLTTGGDYAWTELTAPVDETTGG